jgi:hypothetical protein
VLVSWYNDNCVRVTCQVRKDSHLGQLFDRYAEQCGTEVRYLRFFLDGMRIKRDHTIAMLNMEDDSVIQALIEAEGGV